MAQVFMMNSINKEPERLRRQAENNPKITNPHQLLRVGVEVLLAILAAVVGCFGLLLLAWCLG